MAEKEIKNAAQSPLSKKNKNTVKTENSAKDGEKNSVKECGKIAKQNSCDFSNGLIEKREIEPIAYIRNDFKEKFGIPRQSGLSPSAESLIIFTPKYRDENALKEIDDFDYLWVIFDFSKAHRESFSPTVRPPRLGGNKRVGVFASRSPFRPNSLGLSSVKLLGVERSASYGCCLRVAGADMLDGTPIFDIKPYVPYSDCHAGARGGYTEKLGSLNELAVKFAENVQNILPPEKLSALVECLKQDPRPGYKKADGEVFGMRFSDYNVKVTVTEKTLTVLEIVKL